MFQNDRIMFWAQTLDVASQLKNNMTSDYGIIPFPKYDESQERYRTGCRDALTAFLVPASIKNRDMVGMITEALCMESRTKVVPAYYETALKYKYFNDSGVIAMLDKIRDSVCFDFVVVFNYPLNYPFSQYSNSINAKTASILATTKANAKVLQSQLTTIYDKLSSLQ